MGGSDHTLIRADDGAIPDGPGRQVLLLAPLRAALPFDDEQNSGVL
jgi:hypothetical protein